MSPREKQIQELLEAHPDGLTCNQIVDAIKLNRSYVYELLDNCPGIYVDRWQPTGGVGRKAAVFCRGDLDDCPHPTLPTKERRRAK